VHGCLVYGGSVFGVVTAVTLADPEALLNTWLEELNSLTGVSFPMFPKFSCDLKKSLVTLGEVFQNVLNLPVAYRTQNSLTGNVFLNFSSLED